MNNKVFLFVFLFLLMSEDNKSEILFISESPEEL